jgi:hypothetical protein
VGYGQALPLDMEELREHRRFEERETNGVMLMER